MALVTSFRIIAAALMAMSRSSIGRQRLRVPEFAGMRSSCHASPVVVSIRRVFLVPFSGSVPSWSANLADCEQEAHRAQRNNRSRSNTNGLVFLVRFLIKVICNLYDVARRFVWFNAALGPGLFFLA